MPRPRSAAEVDAFRDKLCEAATRLFVRHGAEGFTMRMLAAEAGCATMTSYRYFKDKDELLAAVRARAYDRFSQALESAARTPGDSRAKSSAIGEAYVAFALANREAYRLMFEMSPSDSMNSPDLARAAARAHGNMTGYVRAMIDDGALKGDPDLIGRMFWAAIHGVVQLELTGVLPPGPGADAMRREMMRALFIGLNSRGPRAQSLAQKDDPPLAAAPDPRQGVEIGRASRVPRPL